MQFHEFSYANDSQPRMTRWIIRAIEGMSGRNKYFHLYNIWRNDIVPSGERVFGRMLELIDIQLGLAQQWPPKDLPSGPLVLVANHPFGIGDGVAVLALAESLGRPFRVLINNDLLKIKEMEKYALPVSFDETKEALALNMKTRHEAVRLLKEGVTIVVFPAGGVATATKVFGKAADLPWKIFPAKLVQAAGASVVPIHFAGQNGRLFHIVSKFSLTLRLSLLVREFSRLRGKSINVKIGDVLPWSQLSALGDRKVLLETLYNAVFSLEPASRSKADRFKDLVKAQRY
ncbi:MAG: lysophospholipid acyltransferase family protein [Rhizobiaceae bacterium]